LPALGYLAACVAVLTAYVRAIGKAAGASNLFVGPMAKPQRMFVTSVVALLMTVLPRSWQPEWGNQRLGLPALALAAVIIGGLITVLRRLNLIVRHLKAQN
jgi:phosphatidylglycerophosphate synthase